MSILDFREIPEAGKGGGDQDQFELFARECLEVIGYNTIDGPDRGADGGRDLVVDDQRQLKFPPNDN